MVTVRRPGEPTTALKNPNGRSYHQLMMPPWARYESFQTRTGRRLVVHGANRLPQHPGVPALVPAVNLKGLPIPQAQFRVGRRITRQPRRRFASTLKGSRGRVEHNSGEL